MFIVSRPRGLSHFSRSRHGPLRSSMMTRFPSWRGRLLASFGGAGVLVAVASCDVFTGPHRDRASGTTLAVLVANHGTSQLDDITTNAITLPLAGTYLVRVRCNPPDGPNRNWG